MNCQTLVCIIWVCLAAQCVVGAQVEPSKEARTIVVTVPSAELKVGDAVIAKVSKGQRFDVLNEAPGWVWVQVDSPTGAKQGWIKADQGRVLQRVFSLMEMGQSSEAMSFAQTEYERLAGNDGSVDRTAVDALNRLGLAKLAGGEAGGAVEDFRRVWKERGQLSGTESAQAAEAINNLAVALFHAGNYSEARPLLQQAWQMRNKVLGPTHHETLRAIANLVNFEKIAYASSSDWELLTSLETEMQKKLLAGETAGSPTSADLLLMRETKIRHPMLRLTFAAPGFGAPERIEQPIPQTVDAASWLTRMGLLTDNNENLGNAAAIVVANFGQNHFQTAMAFANLAGKPQFPFGDPELIPGNVEPERLQLLQSALSILQTNAAGNANHIAIVRHNLGIALLSVEESRQLARRHLQEAFEIFHRLGEKNPRTGLAAETLGLAAYIDHDYEEAVRRLSQAHEIEHESLGPAHVYTTATLNSLGAAYYQLGNFVLARDSIERTLRLRQETLGASHQDSLRSMNDLGVVLSAQGDYVGARNLFEYCLQRLKQQPEPDLWLAQQIEANLWVVRLQMGDYEPARQYFEAVLQSDDTFEHRNALANLATVARLQGRLPDARRLLEKAISMFPDDLNFVNDLGTVAREQGDLETAARLLNQVVAQKTQDQFPNPKEVAFSLTSLAVVEQRMQRFDAARNRLLRALEFYTAELGPQNPRTTEVLRFLGQTELLAGKPAEARTYLESALRNKLSLAESILPTLSEAEALAYVVAFDERDLLLESIEGTESVMDAYEIVWQTRALATRVLSTRISRPSDDPQIRQLQARLREVRKELAGIVLAFVDNQQLTSAPPREQALQELGQEKEQLERELASTLRDRGIDETSFETPDGSVREFLEVLPPNVAVVDFLRLHRVRGQPGWYYEAFILNSLQADGDSETAVRRVSLGPAAEIDALVADFRSSIASRREALSLNRSAEEQPAASKDPGWSLRNVVWEKLEKNFESADTILVVPDGAFTAVPWYALPSQESGRYLLEDYAIGTVTFPQRIRQLLEPATDLASQELLAGGIDFSSKPEVEIKHSFKPAPTRGASWTRLPATREEVRVIAELSNGDPLLLEGSEASESRLMEEMPASRFIHLATHGFFADPDLLSATLRKSNHDHLLTEVQTTAESSWAPAVTTLDSIIGRNPLVLSGVVLAGASDAAETNDYGAPLGDDGILTAEEVASLDLRGTELVVLSACETGLGAVAGGEGVFGLQRSFDLAGARASITSLWKVDDAATSSLMTEFYRNLWKAKMTKLEALRQAQLWMLRKQQGQAAAADTRGRIKTKDMPIASSERLPPFYWAAFVLSGDWQ